MKSKVIFLTGCPLILIATIFYGSHSQMATPPQNVSDLQVTYKDGLLKGILSFKAITFASSRTNTRDFIAVWYEKAVKTNKANEETLVIYERKGDDYEELFNFVEKSQRKFRGFAPLGSLQVPGVIVTFSSEEDLNGETAVIAFVDNKFQFVYKGNTSEFVDLDGDGITEIFESFWPNGDGFPKKTIVHIWNGSVYVKLYETKWEDRFSRNTQALLKKRSYKRLTVESSMKE